jgi:hypothetical protein
LPIPETKSAERILTLKNPDVLREQLVAEAVHCRPELVPEDLQGPQHDGGRVPAVRPRYQAAAPFRYLENNNKTTKKKVYILVSPPPPTPEMLYPNLDGKIFDFSNTLY